ncbi:FimV family protein [Oceanicoccus sagamiensis]|uniref:LysM domain-containing protein n=1 Tax=Oceanicoccus sagamiensis TaxID=716816 RepID=A0A1X9NBM6_9GAMM|nr:FimV/HubP family polar landmark protein [Oceanicoccus sagamiensis]ARN75006.1 hypothetical protein BST96_13310 [Oceanicoccus sagamiensis]
MLFRHPNYRGAQSVVARIIRAAALCVGLLASTYAHALGLGELRSSSFLGEPLVATIDVLLEGEDYGPDDIKVRQLNSVESSKLGIDLAGYQSFYRLTPITRNGRLIIKLTSSEPVREPFLNMLVELKWPTGTVYREYTVFLDPVTLRPSAEPAPQPQATSPVKPTVTPEPNSRLQAGSGTYRVRSGDSLSKIASRLVEGTDTSRSNMMQWLLQNNPRAFINGEMNRLLAGVQLKLPAGNEAKDISPRPAAQPRPQPVAAAPKAAPQPAPPEPETKQRLTIVTPMADRAAVAKGKTAETDNLEALQTQMAVTNEVVERLRRENEAMRQRLIAIEKSGYVTSLERLVLLKEQEISTLEERLSQSPAVAPAAEPAAPEPTAAPTVEPAQPAKDSSSTVQQLWLAIILLVTALLGMLFFLLRWRSQSSPVAAAAASENTQQESELLQELDDIIDAQSAFDVTANTAASAPESSGSKDVFDAINQPPSNRFDRRPDDIVKQSIQAKTQTYSPPQLQESDKTYHDEVDELISDAIEAANRGAFDVAEALLVAERTHQARDPSGDRGEIDSRIELALEFVEQLRQGQHSAG